MRKYIYLFVDNNMDNISFICYKKENAFEQANYYSKCNSQLLMYIGKKRIKKEICEFIKKEELTS